MTEPIRIKQVILIRRDLKMRRGKEVAQGSHASMEFIVARIRGSGSSHDIKHPHVTQLEREWINGGMAKICLQVTSEEELLKYHSLAREAGLASHTITDSGRTEFGGRPTLTSCAIGPGPSDEIDKITSDLKLY